jgi:A/G-specific adenine glycosylase
MKTRRLARKFERWWLLLLRTKERNGQERFWLERRPAPGIWAGLYCPPVFAEEKALFDALPASLREELQPLEPVAHSLTHRELHLHPMLLNVLPDSQHPTLAAGNWVAADALVDHGLPTPVRQLLGRLI